MWWRRGVNVNVRDQGPEEEEDGDDDVVKVFTYWTSLSRLGCIFWEGDEDCDRGEKMENTYAFWSNLVGLTGWLPREAAAETQISHPSLSIG